MAKILLADDSETILLLLRTRLEMLDAIMPRKSGIDALRELRAEGIDIPALIVSAHTEGGNGVDDSELAIGGYIAKPIDFDQLFAKIAELTDPAE